MHITDHRQTNPIDFGEYRMKSFFIGIKKKNSYALRPVESNSLKYSSIQMVLSIELKFSMYIIGHCPTYCVEFWNLG